MPDLTSALAAATSILSPSSPPHQEEGGFGGVEDARVDTSQDSLSDPSSSPPATSPLATSSTNAGRKQAPDPRHTRARQRGQAKRRFLAALEEYPLLTRAARLGGHRLETFHAWAERDPDFASRWEESVNVGIERLELRVHEDALHGTDREATLQRMFALKRHRPEYREGYTVTHKTDRSGAQEAALLRRAIVEALAPYPEARAALASVLSRLTGTPAAVGGDLEPAGGGSTDAIGRHLEQLAAGSAGAIVAVGEVEVEE